MTNNQQAQSNNLDEFHRHEIIDRIHIIRDMFDTFILDHPAAYLIGGEAKIISESLGKLYQYANRIDFEIEKYKYK